MANKDNQSKQYRIYIKESKSWVDVNKEFYTDYYREINAYRKRQQEHGRCVCPASKRYLCDMDCMTCPYPLSEPCSYFGTKTELSAR